MVGTNIYFGRKAARGSMLAVAGMMTVSCVPAARQDLALNNLSAPLVAEALVPAQAATIVPTSEAMAANARLPISQGFNPPATSFRFTGGSDDSMRAAQCLAEAIYYEARSESADGQRAVAQVVLNRVRHAAFPKSVCGVVYQGASTAPAPGVCQFSFACDGSLRRSPVGASWDQAHRIAAAALAGSVYAPVGNATNYHTYQVLPRWAFKLNKVAVIGAHIFYGLTGAWGQPSAFNQAYAGREAAGLAYGARLRSQTQFAASQAPDFGPAPRAETVRGIALAEPAAEPVSQGTPLVPHLGKVIANAQGPAVALPQTTARAEFANSGRIRERPLDTE